MASARDGRHGAGSEIADDVLREALARLRGLQDLVRCAATCRRWRRLVTDRAFLRRVGCWPDTVRHPCVLAGTFSQKSYPFLDATRLWRKKRSLYEPPQFLSLQAGGGPHLTFHSFFVARDGDDDDGLLDLARPLASRRGFLLVRVVLPPSAGGGDYYRRKLHLAVCGPLVDRRKTHLLPPPPFDMTENFSGDSLTGCTILTGADDYKQQPMFRVLLIHDDDDDGFVSACTYDSDTGSWSGPVKCSGPSGLIRCGPRAGVVAGGTAHWLFMNETNQTRYTLNVCVATSRVSLTEIPAMVYAAVPRAMIPCVAGEDGMLSFVTIRDHGVAELWTQQEQDGSGANNGVWQCCELTEAELGSEETDMVFFAESRGALLVKQGGAFSIFDLRSKEMAPMRLEDEGTRHVHWFVESCSSSCCSGHPGRTCLFTPPVLYEMDWIFSHRVSSSQLGD
jgi:hypothetical protein